MLTTDGECSTGLSMGPICNSIARVSRNSSASGISFQPKRGLPMSTVNCPPFAFQQLISPAGVSKVIASSPLAPPTIDATQRIPLPQAPASEPSLL